MLSQSATVLGSLWQFKRDEVPNNNADFTIDNSQSFKYKAALIGKTADAVNNTFETLGWAFKTLGQAFKNLREK